MLKVLIVDDEEAILQMYGDRLKEEDCQVFTSESGDEAIEIAKKEHPDLIFLDIIMPKINGLDVLKILKNELDTKNIPVYLLTNLPEGSTGDKAKELGADDYLVKAEVEPKKLSEIVNSFKKKSADKSAPVDKADEPTDGEKAPEKPA